MINNYRIRGILVAFAFILPTFLGLAIFYYYPFVQNIINSFLEIDYFDNVVGWVGLSNYKEVLNNEHLSHSIIFTMKYAIVTTVLSVVLSLLFAIALNKNIKGVGIYRVLFYLPVIAMPIAIIAIWKWIFNYDFGFANAILVSMGFVGVPWLRESDALFFVIVLIGVWGRVGYNMIIIYAGLQNIPTLYYEAAKIDGANAVSRFFNITIPMISPTLFFVTVLTTISSLQVFESIYGLITANTKVAQESSTVIYTFFEYAFVNNQKGVASALSVIFLIIILIITIIQFVLQKYWVHYDQN
ncbi:carbohydrate ABC transporter permease [Brachyspira pilosicoli]|uniref:Sugar ABC transporter permease n=1 Tax=Brachyspira pilosicoli TaxID=52584 RepID=A0A5C8EUM1_BRAPL|nr:sugar ABC transporter permease [Brachyspira pilosicoli]TXJ41575.1 sugar ABC transporter permease [Brachyspira pilosicoli]